jgi:hypothetical protein
MLIINNGVPKSGSTWIQSILRETLSPSYPDKKWLNSWKNPSIEPEKLRDYIESGEWKGPRPVLIKMHIPCSSKFDYLLQDGIKVIVSNRNIPDSVLSWFHHQVREGKVNKDHLKPWCESSGRKFALAAIRHSLSWAAQPGTIMVRYEEMVSDAGWQIGKLLEQLGFPITEERRGKVAFATQVIMSENAPPRDGMHVRTAGQSKALQELPKAIYNEFLETENCMPDMRLIQRAVQHFSV